MNHKTVFITGSNRGIGKAILERYVENGWNAVAHARKETSGFETYINKLALMNNVKIIPCYFDMCDYDRMKNEVKRVVYEPKLNIDALINNAGALSTKLFLMFPMSEIKNIFEVNLFAQMRITQLVLKRMAKQGGSIVNVASIAGIDIQKAQSAYGVSKAALITWTQVLSKELMGRIRVNAVAPGQTDTDMGNSSDIAVKHFIENAGRLVTAKEVANAVYWLSSDEAGFVNGTIIRVDGGG